jgi:hypothetical protein
MSDAMFMFLVGALLLLGQDKPTVVFIAGVSIFGCGVLGLIVDRSKK